MIRYLALTTTLILGAPLAAQAENDPFYAFIEKTMGTTPVTNAVYKDMDGDGRLEALVTTANCDADGCDWSLFSSTPSGPALVGNSHGPDAHFEATEGGGEVVISGGVVWAYSGRGQMYPWDSALGPIQNRPASSDERNSLARALGIPAEKMDIEMYDVALFGNGLNQHVAWVRGLYSLAGDAGYPFALIDGGGKVIVTGYSRDVPMFYRDGEGGAWIVANTPAGYQMTHVAAKPAGVTGATKTSDGE